MSPSSMCRYPLCVAIIYVSLSPMCRYPLCVAILYASLFSHFHATCLSFVSLVHSLSHACAFSAFLSVSLPGDFSFSALSPYLYLLPQLSVFSLSVLPLSCLPVPVFFFACSPCFLSHSPPLAVLHGCVTHPCLSPHSTHAYAR